MASLSISRATLLRSGKRVAASHPLTAPKTFFANRTEDHLSPSPAAIVSAVSAAMPQNPNILSPSHAARAFLGGDLAEIDAETSFLSQFSSLGASDR